MVMVAKTAHCDGVNLGGIRQRMVTTRIQRGDLLAQRDPLVAGLGRHEARVAEAEINLLRIQLGQQRRQVAQVHPRHQPGVLLAQLAQQLGHDHRRRDRRGTENDLTGIAEPDQLDIALQVARVQHQGAGPAQHHLAGRCQAGALRPPVKQLEAHALLQCLDASTEGRLAEVHTFRSDGEAALFGQRNEVGQPPDVHVLLPIKCLKRNE